MSFAKAISLDANDFEKAVCLSNIAMERLWDGFFDHSNIVVFREEKMVILREFSDRKDLE